MLTTIKCYGKVARMVGKKHRVQLDTNTPAEAVRFLCSQFPQLRAYLMGAKDNGVGFAVFRGKENLKEENLKEPVGSDEIRIAPVILGSKSGGVFSIILGVVLIAASFIPFLAPIAPYLMSAGVSMIVGGVVQMLTPVPKGTKNKSVDNEPSYAFNGAVNTQAQGNPVPLLYGRMIVGSAVISAGISAEDYAPITSGIGTGAVTGGSPIRNPYDSRRPLAIA